MSLHKIISHKSSRIHKIKIKILNFHYSIILKLKIINIRTIRLLQIRRVRKSLKYFHQWSTLPSKNLPRILQINPIQKISLIYHCIRIWLCKNHIDFNIKGIKLMTTTSTKKICIFFSYKESCNKNKNKLERCHSTWMSMKNSVLKIKG